MAKTNSGLRRQRDCRNVGFLYKEKFGWIDWCIYCGQPATTIDHVLPIRALSMIDTNHPSFKKHVFQGLSKVKSCKQCNSIAGSRRFFSILEKRDYIQKKLYKKYKKKLRTVEWTEDELNELGRNLRADVEKMIHNREVLESRIYFPSVRPSYLRKG